MRGSNRWNCGKIRGLKRKREKVKKGVDIFRQACIIYKCSRENGGANWENRITEIAEDWKFLNKNIDKWTRTWYTNFCWCEISVKSTKIKIKKCLTREWRFDKIIFAAEKQIWSLKTEQWIWINTTHSQFKQTETNAKKTNFAGLEKPELARRTG